MSLRREGGPGAVDRTPHDAYSLGSNWVMAQILLACLLILFPRPGWKPPEGTNSKHNTS